APVPRRTREPPKPRWRNVSMRNRQTRKTFRRSAFVAAFVNAARRFSGFYRKTLYSVRGLSNRILPSNDRSLGSSKMNFRIALCVYVSLAMVSLRAQDANKDFGRLMEQGRVSETDSRLTALQCYLAAA